VILDLDSTSYTAGWSAELLSRLITAGEFRQVARYGDYVVLQAGG